MKRFKVMAVVAFWGAILFAGAAPAQLKSDMALGIGIAGQAGVAGVSAPGLATVEVKTPVPSMLVTVVVGPEVAIGAEVDFHLLVTTQSLSDENGLAQTSWEIPAWMADRKVTIQAFSVDEAGDMITSPSLLVAVGSSLADGVIDHKLDDRGASLQKPLAFAPADRRNMAVSADLAPISTSKRLQTALDGDVLDADPPVTHFEETVVSENGTELQITTIVPPAGAGEPLFEVTLVTAEGPSSKAIMPARDGDLPARKVPAADRIGKR